MNQSMKVNILLDFVSFCTHMCDLTHSMCCAIEILLQHSKEREKLPLREANLENALAVLYDN